MPARPVPPLLDREIFFGDPEISNGQLSPDGHHLSFVRPLEGVRNVWVKRLEEPFEAARPMTDARDRPILSYFWSRDGRRLLFVKDDGGDENFRVHAVDPRAEPAPGSRVPGARDLTPYADVQARIYAVPKGDPDHVLVGLNDRDPELHDVYRLDLRTGERELVFANEAGVAQWVADLDGRLRIGYRQTDDGGHELLRVDADELISIYRCGPLEICTPIRFHRDGRRLYLETNRGQDVDLSRLVLLDPESGRTEPVESDPEGRVDFGGALFAEDTEALVATWYVDDRVRYYPRDDRFAGDLERARAELPEGDLFFGSMTEDGRRMLVSVRSDVEPGRVFLLDRVDRSFEALYRIRPDVPVEHMARMTPLRYRARDGVEIPAYLTLPVGVEPSRIPIVVLPHGGPWVRDEWGYDGVVQFLANRGYAVLQPNFRGSTGFGKRFLNLGNRQWGTGGMQHDLTDGVAHLVEEGIADPDRVAIMGGSYGGYATLAGVAFTPEVYAAGVSIVGPSSILTLLRSIPPYWEPVRKTFTVRVGDLDDPDDVARMREQSPLYAAERIEAPLLVVQGANDPRVKKAESDQIVAALRDLGRPVEYLVASDEGHGFAHESNNLALFAVVERFLAEHLGGRYQAELSGEVARKLDQLLVDVETIAERADRTAAG